MKYGTTLSGGSVDYLDTAGNVIWDSSSNAGYWNDVAGFGRDDDEGLSQTASKSANQDALLKISLSSNASGLNDKEYFFWSNDDGTISGTVTTSLPATVDSRISRIWKAIETT